MQLPFFVNMACVVRTSAALTLSASFQLTSSGEVKLTIPRDPILTIEPGSHSGRVSTVAVDRRGRVLLTTSNDKTARLWELPSLRLLSTIRPPVGATPNEGKLRAGALSPDGQTIAIGGWTGHEWDPAYCVYLFDRNGTLIKRLQGLPDRILSITFSSNGRSIAVGLRTGGIHVFDTVTGSCLRIDASYGKGVYGIFFCQDGRLLACCDDGSITEYAKNLTIQNRIRWPASMDPFSISSSPDGKYIAVGDYNNRNVIVYSSDLKELYRPDTTGVNATGTPSVSWSLDGNYLFAGTYDLDDEKPHILRKWSDKGKGPYKDYSCADNSILSLVPVENNGIAYSGYDCFGLITSNGNVSSNHNRLADPRGIGKSFKVSPNGEEVQFAYSILGKNRAIFSLRKKCIQPANQDLDKTPSPTDTSGETVRIQNWRNNLHPSLGGHLLPLEEFEMSRSYALLPRNQGIILGASWYLRRFDSTGRLTWKVSTPGEAWAVSVAKDGSLVVAAFDDGTVRWYRADNGALLLSLFPDVDGRRWVAWTPSGYYDCSIGGEDLIGWSVNRSSSESADYYAFSRFRSDYYRPDIVELVLSTLSESQAVTMANSLAGRSSAVPIGKEVLPPIVKAISKASRGNSLILSFSVQCLNSITRIVVQANGRPIAEQRQLKLTAMDASVRKIEIPIEYSDKVIDIVAYSGETHPSEPTFFVDDLTTERLPTPPDMSTNRRVPQGRLLALVVGIDQYGNAAETTPLSFAEADAVAFSKTLKKQSALYKEVSVKLLTGRSATHDNVLEGLSWLESAGSNDTSIVFLAGHGSYAAALDRYFFLPFDFDGAHIKNRWITAQDLADPAIRSKLVFFLDTCHAGALNTGRSGFANVLGSSENGACVFSACDGGGSALESRSYAGGHGAFTMALLDAFRGAPGVGGTAGSPYIYAHRLDGYLYENVLRVTAGQQHTGWIPPAQSDDFILGKTTP